MGCPTANARKKWIINILLILLSYSNLPGPSDNTFCSYLKWFTSCWYRNGWVKSPFFNRDEDELLAEVAAIESAGRDGGGKGRGKKGKEKEEEENETIPAAELAVAMETGEVEQEQEQPQQSSKGKKVRFIYLVNI